MNEIIDLMVFLFFLAAGKNPNNMSDLQRAAEARQFLMDMAPPQGPGNGGAGGSGNSRQSNWKT